MDRFSPRITLPIESEHHPGWTLRLKRHERYESGRRGHQPASNTADTSHATTQTVQLTETQVVNPHVVNETHFQYFRQRTNQVGVDPELNISVNDEFTSGSTFPLAYSHVDNYELQNYTSITHNAHYIKFGARLREGIDNNYTTANYCWPVQLHLADGLSNDARRGGGG